MTRMWMNDEEREAAEEKSRLYWLQSDEEIGRDVRALHERIEAKTRAFAESWLEDEA